MNNVNSPTLSPFSTSFAIIDDNNFFVSCERVFNPSLNNKAVIVLSNNDGCAISRSNEDKALGIPMGAPFHTFSHLIKPYDIKIFSSNFELYGDLSNRIMQILQTFTSDIKIYSIDEAFLNLSTLPHVNHKKLA
jgi:DNA polymerase V